MLNKNREVLGIENLETRKVCSIDPLYNNQWGLSAVKANSIAESNPVVVAIVDSGIDLNHEDLKNNIWKNPFEMNDGIDNDNNGYVDDLFGWNFVGQNNNVNDDYYHGTHVAGIVAAEKNGVGIAGVGANAKIMSLKFQNSSGLGYTGAAVSAINYAVKMKNAGINVAAINLSWGGGTSINLSLQKALQNASDNGIVVVSAAGNNGGDNDITPRYPSSYKFSNSISVGAINKDFTYASYSNYGKNSVELAAPGTDILSTLPGNRYGYVSGSSTSAPFVSGAVAFLRGLGYGASVVKNAILNGSSFLSSLADKVGFGLLNVEGALSYLKNNSVTTSPSVPLVVSPEETSPVVVSSLDYKIEILSSLRIRGWVRDNSNLKKRIMVEVVVNDKDFYSRKANIMRSDLGGRFGFNIRFDSSKFVRGSNKITIRFIDPLTKETIVINKELLIA